MIFEFLSPSTKRCASARKDDILPHYYFEGLSWCQALVSHVHMTAFFVLCSSANTTGGICATYLDSFLYLTLCCVGEASLPHVH